MFLFIIFIKNTKDVSRGWAVWFAATKEGNSVAAPFGLCSGLRQRGMGFWDGRLRPG